jgi:hypothetical protein
MNSPTLKKTLSRRNEDESTAPGFRSIVRKSALLNVVIVLTSCPVLVLAGGKLSSRHWKSWRGSAS